MSTLPAEQTVRTPPPSVVRPEEITVYSHSMLFYWWPLWVIGYLFAALTYLEGTTTLFAEATVIIHPSKNLGVIYTAVFLLVLVMTHATVRGVASLAVITTLLAVTFLFAYLGWWDDVFRAFSGLAIYMNLGFYVFFSTAVLVVWLLSFFVFDRMNYWTFRPGQMIHNMVFGSGAKTYDTHGMMVFKLRDDLFRHWILGIGSGDLHIAATGARKAEFVLPNVLFIGSKIERIQQFVAMQPDETTPAAVPTLPAS